MVYQEEIDREKDDAHDHDYRGVLDVVRRGKRRAPKLLARLAHKLAYAFLLVLIQCVNCFRHFLSPPRTALSSPVGNALLAKSEYLVKWQGYQDSNPDLRFWRPPC